MIEKVNRLYRIWNNMRTRCNKPYSSNYARYGGRGIKVCPEWDNLDDGFKNFESWAKSNGYTDELTIDRINNDGNYCPDNCRLVTMKEQNRNKSNSRMITYNGETLHLLDMAEKYNISLGAIDKRLSSGWDLEKIFTTPVKNTKRTVTYGNKEVTLKELSRMTGVNYNTICTRYTRGASVEEMISPDKKSDKLKKIILKIDKCTGEIVGRYKGSQEAVKSVNGKARSRIIECCNGMAESAYGFKWKYE